jgi:hypothetical protein
MPIDITLLLNNAEYGRQDHGLGVRRRPVAQTSYGQAYECPMQGLEPLA